MVIDRVWVWMAEQSPPMEFVLSQKQMARMKIVAYFDRRYGLNQVLPRERTMPA
jgi:hypothetical protein